MALDMFEADLCDTCVYFVEYGTTGDASAGEPSEDQRRADASHAALMRLNLGVTPRFFETPVFPDDVGGSFSWAGCEGCGATGCHVYTGAVLFELETEESQA